MTPSLPEDGDAISLIPYDIREEDTNDVFNAATTDDSGELDMDLVGDANDLPPMWHSCITSVSDTILGFLEIGDPQSHPILSIVINQPSLPSLGYPSFENHPN